MIEKNLYLNGQIPPMSGKHHTEETRKKMSEGIKNSNKHKKFMNKVKHDKIFREKKAKKISIAMKEYFKNKENLDKVVALRKKSHEDNPKITKEQMIECINNAKFITGAVQYFNKHFGTISRPTFDVYKKRYYI